MVYLFSGPKGTKNKRNKQNKTTTAPQNQNNNTIEADSGAKDWLLGFRQYWELQLSLQETAVLLIHHKYNSQWGPTEYPSSGEIQVSFPGIQEKRKTQVGTIRQARGV